MLSIFNIKLLLLLLVEILYNIFSTLAHWPFCILVTRREEGIKKGRK